MRSRLARLDEEVVDVARVVVALPAVGEGSVVRPLARGGPLARPAEALSLRLARRLRLGPGQHPDGVRTLLVRVLVGVDAEIHGPLARLAALLVREGVADPDPVEVVALEIETLALDLGAERGRYVDHALRTRGGSVGRGRRVQRGVVARRFGPRRGRSRGVEVLSGPLAPQPMAAAARIHAAPLIAAHSYLNRRRLPCADLSERSAVTSSTVAEGCEGLRDRIPEVRLLAAAARPMGRPAGSGSRGSRGSRDSRGGGGSVGASASLAFRLGRGTAPAHLRKLRPRDRRLRLFLVRENLLSGHGIVLVASRHRSVKGSPEQTRTTMRALGS